MSKFDSLVYGVWVASAILWYCLALFIVPFIAGSIVKISWEFFTTKLDDPNRWPFGNDLLQIYKWGGKINYDVGSLYSLNGVPLKKDLVKLQDMKWHRDPDGRWVIEMTYVTMTIDEATVKIQKETNPVISDVNVNLKGDASVLKKAMERAMKIAEKSVVKGADPRITAPALHPLYGCSCSDCERERKKGGVDLFPFKAINHDKTLVEFIWATSAAVALRQFCTAHGRNPRSVELCEVPNMNFQDGYHKRLKEKPMLSDVDFKSVKIGDVTHFEQLPVTLKEFRIVRDSDKKVVCSSVRAENGGQALRRFTDGGCYTQPELGQIYDVVEIVNYPRGDRFYRIYDSDKVWRTSFKAVSESHALERYADTVSMPLNYIITNGYYAVEYVAQS